MDDARSSAALLDCCLEALTQTSSNGSHTYTATESPTELNTISPSDSIADGDATAEIDLFFWLSAPIVTFLYACIFVIGVIGNLLVCYVVAAYKDMRDNIFHIFLA